MRRRAALSRKTTAELGNQVSADGLFSAAGGDGLFYQNNAAPAAIDFRRRHGVNGTLLRVALEAAQVDSITIWDVLKRALKDVAIRERVRPLVDAGKYQTLVNPELVQSLRESDRFVHPWFRDVDGLSPGKFWHLLTISVPPPFYDPMGNREEDPETVYPLTSQPLVELCLRIPTYVLIHGGWDRAIVRKAFENDVPPSIIRRRGKGESTHNIREIFERNLPFIRESLLDGLMVREGLLDRAQLAKSLTVPRSLQTHAFVEIVTQHLCTEAWLRQWSERRQRIAA